MGDVPAHRVEDVTISETGIRANMRPNGRRVGTPDRLRIDQGVHGAGHGDHRAIVVAQADQPAGEGTLPDVLRAIVRWEVDFVGDAMGLTDEDHPAVGDDSRRIATTSSS